MAAVLQPSSIQPECRSQSIFNEIFVFYVHKHDFASELFTTHSRKAKDGNSKRGIVSVYIIVKPLEC